jgi:hypothetical protein
MQKTACGLIFEAAAFVGFTGLLTRGLDASARHAVARLLLPREEKTALAAFDSLFPSGVTDRLELGAADVDMRAFLLDVLAAYPPRLRNGLRALFWILEVTALIRFGRSFGQLPRDVREGVIGGFYNSRIYWLRYIALMLKTIGALGYFGFPEVRERIGYIKPRNLAPVGFEEAVLGPPIGSSEAALERAGER